MRVTIPSPLRAWRMRRYRRYRHRRIEIKLRDVSQLFNSMDPSPFKDKDLDHDAEEFIVSWATEFPVEQPVTLRVHLENWPPDNPKETIRLAVHNYFAYRSRINKLELRRLMKQGRTSLLIGLTFLTICLVTSNLAFSPADVSDTWVRIVQESLTISGWVAMWRPMEIYLYDWWPVRRRGRIFRKLSTMPIEVVQKARKAEKSTGDVFTLQGKTAATKSDPTATPAKAG